MLFFKKLRPKSAVLRTADGTTAVKDPVNHPASSPTQDHKDVVCSGNKAVNFSKYTWLTVPGLYTNTDRYFDSVTFSDITLQFSQHKIKAHKVILSSQSVWFAKAFTGSFQVGLLISQRPCDCLCWLNSI